jgi:hypothetical protein
MHEGGWLAGWPLLVAWPEDPTATSLPTDLLVGPPGAQDMYLVSAIPLVSLILKY